MCMSMHTDKVVFHANDIALVKVVCTTYESTFAATEGQRFP